MKRRSEESRRQNLDRFFAVISGVVLLDSITSLIIDFLLYNTKTEKITQRKFKNIT